ncbi:MAG TPA: ABC transporter substrate-binding protein [Burkholderiales bacterium]|jgi:NitT/TauT family transport system substrate-binding protein
MHSRISLSRIATVAAALLLCLSSNFSAYAQGQKLTPVRYEETIRSLMFLPSYVALSKGYFKQEGLDVAMRTSQGTDKSTAALVSGNADIILVGPEASVYVQTSESPLKPRIFAGVTATDGFFLVGRSAAQKFNWATVKGKTILGLRPGSTPDVFLEAALRKHGLDPRKDVKIVNNLGPAARPGAWLAGQADFGIFTEPDATTLEKDGKTFVVASIGAEVGPVDYTVFTTTDAYMAKNPKVLQAWTNALAHAQADVANAPAADLAKIAATYFPGTSQEQLVAVIERYRKIHFYKTTPLIDPAAIDRIQDMLIASGLLQPAKRVSPQTILVTDFAKHVK